MKNTIYLIIFSLLAYACADNQPKHLQKTFNSEYFAGLDTSKNLYYTRATLDYELDKKSGRTVQFTSCQQVDDFNAETVVSSQYALFKMLSINCLALKKFNEAKGAKISYLPENLDATTISSFPATAVPKMNEEDLTRRRGKILSGYESKLEFEKNPDGSIIATTSSDEMQYYLLATGDFNNDGIEDYALRVDFRTLNAFGSGSDFFIITRKSNDSPIEIIWRL
jgi:hypothetical protein